MLAFKQSTSQWILEVTQLECDQSVEGAYHIVVDYDRLTLSFVSKVTSTIQTLFCHLKIIDSQCHKYMITYASHPKQYALRAI